MPIKNSNHYSKTEEKNLLLEGKVGRVEGGNG